MRLRQLMGCYQLQGVGEVLSSGSRAQSSHFPGSLPCLVEQMKRVQDNEADSFGITVTMRGKTQLHTSLGVTGNTLHSGNARTKKRDQVSSHCHRRPRKEIHQM